MTFASDPKGGHEEIVALFRQTFAASEGAEEGRMIGKLVASLLSDLAPEERLLCTASLPGQVTGAILFTSLRYPQDPREARLLSPVAVHPGHQRQGIGQALLRFGLDQVRARGADVVMTYGDPAYYGKVGFVSVDAAAVAPPHPLSMPHGWLAQALDGGTLAGMTGPSTCVAPFDRPELW
ncbi:GNAT family N-acetyltransferase [Vannielia litorea]|uniref:Predicted N-acetyltransferase YhbS n=1 Tax=Vannielia litorea TaxID=1217970 RepID=A0A1N6G7F0_9RHOB|nr:N-acetyltransferase [Vannielia litorea]SIO03391.1 Predicted N-acetyltransferase YhbS [Vannielia litorea]